MNPPPPSQPPTHAAPPQSFNPWPVAIVAFFLLFISLTVGLVAFAGKQRSDLVSADYYEQELRFQQTFDQLQRNQSLPDKARIRYEPSSQSLIITLPASHSSPTPNGSVHLYRPSNAALDQIHPVNPAPDNRLSIPTAALAPGPWIVRVAWSHLSNSYAAEQRIVIP